MCARVTSLLLHVNCCARSFDRADTHSLTLQVVLGMLHMAMTCFASVAPTSSCCRTATFCAEAVATLNRRLDMAPTDNWFSSNMYPVYYSNSTYHYQSDGWHSTRWGVFNKVF